MTMNTPRGYTYPCYTDPTNFPAQMQDLATDIDGDVQGILTDVTQARNNPPSLKVQTTGVATPIAAGAVIPLTFVTEIYDNTNMIVAPSPTITIATEGLYLFGFNVTFTGPNNGVRLVQLGIGGFVRCMNTRRRAGTSTQITVEGKMLSNVPAASVVNLLAGSSVATTVNMFQMNITRMTGNTIL